MRVTGALTTAISRRPTHELGKVKKAELEEFIASTEVEV